jgi:hypothetical protein
MDRTFFTRLAESVQQMDEIVRDERTAARETAIDVVGIKQVRRQLPMNDPPPILAVRSRGPLKSRPRI